MPKRTTKRAAVRIYDCVQFFNELDLLEIRLQELSPVVDRFVIVEARQTHDGNPKPLYYEKNKKRFKRWAHKITHVVIDLPKLTLFDRALIKLSTVGPLYKLTSKIVAFGFGRMKMDHYQRRQIIRGLQDADDDDLIMISDLDEIPAVGKVRTAAKLAAKGSIVGFKQRHFIYYLNGEVINGNWIGTKMCTMRYIRETLHNDLQPIRVSMRDVLLQRLLGIHKNIVTVHGGWHFTYLGGWERVLLKKKVFAHSEISTKDDVDPAQIRKDIEAGVFQYKKDFTLRIKYIPLDKNFPKSVLKNRKRYAHLIKRVSR